MTGADAALAGSFAASLAFFGLAALVAVTRRPRTPPALAATSDLGPETPAVANLLANGGRVTPDAVPATLLDLAARHVVKIEETEPGSYGCRLAADAPTGLAIYENRVLNLLRRRAVDGLVPARALTTGPTDEAKDWMQDFRSEVVVEATRAGIVGPRWPAGPRSMLSTLSLGAFVLAVVAFDFGNTIGPSLLAAGISVLSFIVLREVFKTQAEMVTSTGLNAAARWLALRKYLQEDEAFAGLPPTAVAVRDRYLAYGAALGAAAAAVRAVPMGAESDTWAWTRFGGHWQQVRVSYPRHWPPGWGESPWEVVKGAIKFGGSGLVWLWIDSHFLAQLTAGPATDQLTRAVGLAIALLRVAAMGAVAVGIVMLIVAIAAVVGTKEMTGEVIRLRRFALPCYLALYTGNSDHVRAWIVAPYLYEGLTEYQQITVSVVPLLGHIRSISKTTARAVSARATP